MIHQTFFQKVKEVFVEYFNLDVSTEKEEIIEMYDLFTKGGDRK